MNEKKTLIEIIEKNKKILSAKYQKGYLDGSNEQEKKVILDFLKTFDKIANSLSEYIKITNTITIDIPLLIEKVLIPYKEDWEDRLNKNNELPIYEPIESEDI